MKHRFEPCLNVEPTKNRRDYSLRFTGRHEEIDSPYVNRLAPKKVKVRNAVSHRKNPRLKTYLDPNKGRFGSQVAIWIRTSNFLRECLTTKVVRQMIGLSRRMRLKPQRNLPLLFSF